MTSALTSSSTSEKNIACSDPSNMTISKVKTKLEILSLYHCFKYSKFYSQPIPNTIKPLIASILCILAVNKVHFLIHIRKTVACRDVKHR